MKINDFTSNKCCIAIIGLSGVGKTTLSRRLSTNNWFHYSVDYRIWTHYLSGSLNDYLKQLAMSHPILADLLRKDAITVEHRVQFDNLLATSKFMGMLGDTKINGSNLEEFMDRMKQYDKAEKSAMMDIPKFIKRAEDLYDYKNFIIDASGSLCEIVEPDDGEDEILSLLDETCVLIYIRATEKHKKELIRRAIDNPKPIYYRSDFINDILPGLFKHFAVNEITKIAPNDVAAYLYPHLLDHRIARYEKIASRQGYALDMDESFEFKNETDLLDALRQKDT